MAETPPPDRSDAAASPPDEQRPDEHVPDERRPDEQLPADFDDGHVIVVGYDGWTEPVLDELQARGNDVTVVVTDGTAAAKLRERDVAVVRSDDIDEAAFRAAGLADADAVFVATLDEQVNVLAVLTVMNADQSVPIATFAREGSDVPKLRAAGADTVVSLGEVVGELVVEVALSDRSVEDVVAELTARH